MQRLFAAVIITGASLGTALAQGLAPQGGAAGGVTDCDRLASSTYDRDRPDGVPGVLQDKIDAKAAIPACEAALKAAPNDPRIMFQLGRAYAAGNNFDGAFKQYSAAHAKGNVNATVNLGAFYLTGRGVAEDEAESVRLMRIAADQGHQVGAYNLGGDYEAGRGGLAKDDVQALRLYRIAASQGFPAANNAVGIYYESGRGGVAKDDNQAVQYYKRAVDQGFAAGQFNLARFNESGRGGLAKDEVEALRLYRLAASQNLAQAQNAMGNYLHNGRGGLPRDDVEAARMYKLASDQGAAAGQANLAFFCESGSGGLARNDTEALRLYKLAADKNYAAAQSNIGRFYETARGGLTKDEATAARYYKLAADQGYAAAQFNLGRFAESGRGGLPQDNNEASRLYKLAADQGYQPAQKALQQLNARLAQNTSRDTAPTPPVTPAPSIPTAKQVPPPAAPAPRSEKRIALVIGNGAYQSVPVLNNTKNDAKGIADSFRAVGFNVVQLVSDAGRSALIAALSDFERQADNADWAAVYYAGHGMEVDGVNYLVPIDAKLRDDRDVQDEAISVNRVLDAIANTRKLRLVMLDACRDNPFMTTMHRSIASRSISRGLAAIEPVGATLVVFAAKDGQTASDGAGDHSPFTGSLIKRMQEPGVEINKLFRLVTGDVLKATENQQRPFVYGSLPGEEDYFFKPK
jgi:TPR repeat protein